MAKGRRRGAVKTGDKALKKLEAAAEDAPKSKQWNKRKDVDNDGNDAVNDNLDRFHLRRREREDGTILLEDSMVKGDIDDDDDDDDQENMLDLGIPDSSEDDSDDDDDDDDIDLDEDDVDSDSQQVDGSEGEDSDDDDDDDDEEEEEDPDDTDRGLKKMARLAMNWGKRKKDYYHGDVDVNVADADANLEEFEDAEMEEEGGREIEKMRLERMEEGDYDPFADADVDADTNEPEDDNNVGGSGDTMSIKLPQSSLSNAPSLTYKEKMTYLKKNHPEYLPLVQYFTNRFVKNLKDRVSVVSDQLISNDRMEAEAIGCNDAGIAYLYHKRIFETSATLNLCTYLLLKMEGEDVTNHPIVEQLNKFSIHADKLEAKVEGPAKLEGQMQSIVKAVSYMKEQGIGNNEDEDENSVRSVDKEDGKEEESDSDRNEEKKQPISSSAIIECDDENSDNAEKRLRVIEEKQTKPLMDNVITEDDDDDDDEKDHERHLRNETRFGIHNSDLVEEPTKKKKKKRKRKSKSKAKEGVDDDDEADVNVDAMFQSSDYGDDEQNLDEETRRAADIKLAATMNFSTQKRSKRSSAGAEKLDDYTTTTNQQSRQSQDDPAIVGGGDDNVDYDDDDDDKNDNNDTKDNKYDELYAAVAERKQQASRERKSRYAVAPKFPRLEPTVDVVDSRGKNNSKGDSQSRSISQTMLKNRGLVAHKKKLDRNPRVKKREQYRKALIRRKGAVRAIRTEEAHAYGGESTGIKSDLSRSRKLAGGNRAAR